jgi:hypothetical protein
MLVAPWQARGRRHALLRAAIGLALRFDTWRTLVRDHGLTDAQAIDVALRLAHDPPALREVLADEAGAATHA